MTSATDAPGWAGLQAAWRQAYSPLGLLNAGALALPVLYGGFVVSVAVPAILVTTFCAWTYFLAVVRWRLTGHNELPMPSRVLEDIRGSMAVLGTLLASLIAILPAGLAAGYPEVPLPWWPLALLALVWLPIPLVTGAASTNQLAPLFPLRTLGAVSRDIFGYFFMAIGATVQLLVVGVLTWLLGRWLVLFPGVGPWLTCVAFLPALWAIASLIGLWGRAHLSELSVEH